MSKTTHIICILDRSGSMSHLTEQVISNFNRFLSEQQALEGKAKLTLALFDDRYELIYDEVKLKDAKPLTGEQYYTRGMTAMNDAIGRTITNKLTKKRAIVLIHTDGMENASKEYTRDMVKNLVKSKEGQWEFIFAGANIDAKSTGGNLGMTRNYQTTATQKGLMDSYATFGATTACYRSGNNIDSVMPSESVDGIVQSMDNLSIPKGSQVFDTVNPVTTGIVDHILDKVAK